MRISIAFLVVVICGCRAPLPVENPAPSVMDVYTTTSVAMQAAVEESGAAAGLAVLTTALAQTPALSDLCHGLAHELGEAAYEKEGFETALGHEYDICGSGYIHGVVESHLSDVPDLTSALATICPSDAPKCFHGIGHGLMDRSHNDLPGSLKLCATFGERWQRVQCDEGVFMENADADPATHPSEYVKADDPYFACRDRSDVEAGVCAFYAPRIFIREHPGEYAAALTWCATLPVGPRDACAKGVGAVAMKQHISDPLTAASVCTNAAPDQEPYCVQGITSYFIVHFASPDKGAELCTQLTQAHEPICQSIVEESRTAYPAQPS